MFKKTFLSPPTKEELAIISIKAGDEARDPPEEPGPSCYGCSPMTYS